MSRNAMDACIEAANQHDEYVERAVEESRKFTLPTTIQKGNFKMNVQIFKHPHGLGRFVRVARVTIDIPGRVTFRQWVLLECDERGGMTHPATHFPARTSAKSRVAIERDVLAAGFVLHKQFN